jgi:GNAT superfamily N-acetyltransferase
VDDRELYPALGASLEGAELKPVKPEVVGPIADRLAAMDPWLTLGYRPETFTRYLTRRDPALTRYAIEVDELTAGILCVRYPWLLGPYVELLAVFEDCRGRRVGTRVMGWVEQRARASCRNLWTTASAFNSGALRFYATLGFETVAHLEDLVLSDHDEILLRKPLPRKAS